MKFTINDNSKTMIALLAGLAAGAALGLLLAPKTGFETREIVSETLTRVGDELKESTTEQMERISGWKDQLVDMVKEKLGTKEIEIQDDLEHA